MLNALIAVTLAYLLGSVSFAVVVSKVMGLSDPRTYGSKNPGATNVLRTGNKLAAILTLLGDSLKGLLAVLLAQHVSADYALNQDVIAWVGFAAFLGHLYPVFFKFEGGKGVATALGVLLGYNLWLGLAVAATWLIIAFFFRYSSLASLVASVFAVFYEFLLFGVSPRLIAVVLMSGLLVFRHQQNIANLMAGKESKIGGKKSA